MIRQFDAEALLKGVDDVLSVDPKNELEPYACPASLDSDAPQGIAVQRARFDHDGDPEQIPGCLLIDISIPYSQLPTTGIVPNSLPKMGSSFDLPPGTTAELVEGHDRSTLLEDLGYEHERVSATIVETLRTVPAVEAGSVCKPTCQTFDGKAAIFTTEAQLTPSLDPTRPVPESLRLPGQFRKNT